MRAAFAIGLALVAIGYLIIYFGQLVLDDVSADREADQGPAYDQETVRWLEELKRPVEVKPDDASSLDDLLIDLMTADLRMRGHIPSQRRPGDVS